MLFNCQGQQAKVSDRLDSIANPPIRAPPREVLEPDNNTCGDFFRLETRDRIIDQRQHTHH